jgi:hypothetical protein
VPQWAKTSHLCNRGGSRLPDLPEIRQIIHGKGKVEWEMGATLKGIVTPSNGADLSVSAMDLSLAGMRYRDSTSIFQLPVIATTALQFIQAIFI